MGPTVYDLLIIGAGPAGLTAGLYAGRFRLKACIIEKMMPGGQIILSWNIENYPGFPGGLLSEELVARMKQQVDELGVPIESAEVTEVVADTSSGQTMFRVATGSAEFVAKSLVIATGAQPKRLGVAKEEAFIGRGVSYCATCDGPLYKDKEVVVVGGGDKAVEEAIFLTRYCRKVTLVHRRNEFRASSILVEHLKANPKIVPALAQVVTGILGDKKVSGVTLAQVAGGQESTLACDGVFIFVGITPNTGFLKNQLQADPQGFIITQPEMATSLPGIFACGDCRSKSLYQVVNACGEAAVAVNSAHKYLMEQR